MAPNCRNHEGLNHVWNLLTVMILRNTKLHDKGTRHRTRGQYSKGRGGGDLQHNNSELLAIVELLLNEICQLVCLFSALWEHEIIFGVAAIVHEAHL